jgi:RNA polymerase sigma-70 factor (ECF subfamily)
LDEKELIQKILSGDEAAKTSLFQSHRKRLMPVAVYFLGYQDSDLEDVIQETFLIGFEKLKDFKPEASLYTWLSHICIHRCYKRLEKRKRSLQPLDEDLEKMVSTLSLKQFDQQTKDLEKEGLIELARKSLLTLNERCRQVVELRDFQGVSYAQIAQKLEIQMGTVMSRLARCREALKNIVLYELKGHS